MPNPAAANPLRGYCHPMDAAIIRTLDNPVTDLIVKKMVNVSAELTYGQLLSSGVPVSDRSFPEVNAMVEHCARVLRIRKPYVIISNSVNFNALTLGSDEEPSIVLGSMLVKAMTRERLLFVIGHECGHVAMDHLTYTIAANLMASFASSVPVLGDAVSMTAGAALNAWSRRAEISADRAGLLCCNNLQTAKEALLQIELGIVDIRNSNVRDYVENSSRYRSGSVFRRVGEYAQSHPLLPKRIEALDLFMCSSLLFRLAGQTPPQEAISDRMLNIRVEKLIRVL